MRSLTEKRFQRLIAPWYGDLQRLAVRLTGTRDDADDLMQELLLRLQPRMSELERLEKPRPWLTRVLYRLFIDQWRRARGERARDCDVEVESRESDVDSPPDAFERGLTRERLQRALDRLPPFHRELVILHDVEEFTLPEIGTITGTPVGTLKSRLHRARAALRADLSRGP